MASGSSDRRASANARLRDGSLRSLRERVLRVRSSASGARSGRRAMMLAKHSSMIRSDHRARTMPARSSRINRSRSGAGWRTQASRTTTSPGPVYGSVGFPSTRRPLRVHAWVAEEPVRRPQGPHEVPQPPDLPGRGTRARGRSGTTTHARRRHRGHRIPPSDRSSCPRPSRSAMPSVPWRSWTPAGTDAMGPARTTDSSRP
jgi:hypothetical protein